MFSDDDEEDFKKLKKNEHKITTRDADDDKLPNKIIFTDSESDDEDVKKLKKKGHKITSDENDDFSLSPQPSTSKGSKCSKGTVCTVDSTFKSFH